MEIILKYFPDLSAKQIQQFSQLNTLFCQWNEKINLVSRKDAALLYERHILHSLSISKLIQFKPGTKILDVGTGGGFPGIPLAIMFPDSNFLLVDSIAKKIMVVDDLLNQLQLNNAKAKNIRAESLNEKYDFIVSRAVAAFPVFYNWVKLKINKNNKNQISNGILYLKGGDLKLEMQSFYPRYKEFEISGFFSEEFFQTKKIIYLPFNKN